MIYREDITQVFYNGIIFKCPGLFQGEAIIILEKDAKSIIIAIMALYPDLEYFTSVFEKLTETSFQQCVLVYYKINRENTRENKWCQ
jgi:hypothetical protein